MDNLCPFTTPSNHSWFALKFASDILSYLIVMCAAACLGYVIVASVKTVHYAVIHSSIGINGLNIFIYQIWILISEYCICDVHIVSDSFSFRNNL